MNISIRIIVVSVPYMKTGNTEQGKCPLTNEYPFFLFLIGYWYYEKNILYYKNDLFYQALIHSLLPGTLSIPWCCLVYCIQNGNISNFPLLVQTVFYYLTLPHFFFFFMYTQHHWLDKKVFFRDEWVLYHEFPTCTLTFEQKQLQLDI